MLQNKIQLPKGSYHAFCRKMYGVEEEPILKHQTYYKNQRRFKPKTVQTQRPKKIHQFNTFEEYMSKLNNNEDFHSFALKQISKTVDGKQTAQGQRQYKQPNTQRMASGQENSYKKMSHQTQRSSKQRKQHFEESGLRREGTSQLIGAFLPFFKVKLEKEEKQKIKEKSEFKIDNRKFRLKSLLIEENKYVTEKWFPVI